MKRRHFIQSAAALAAVPELGAQPAEAAELDATLRAICDTPVLDLTRAREPIIVESLELLRHGRNFLLSPNNRVEWRGPACLTDGQEIGRDLSGGWFDAGDHWSANLTMSFAAMTLAWSAVEHPEGWTRMGQMDELLESLIHVNRYFLKCVLNPGCQDPVGGNEP